MTTTETATVKTMLGKIGFVLFFAFMIGTCFLLGIALSGFGVSGWVGAGLLLAALSYAFYQSVIRR